MARKLISVETLTTLSKDFLLTTDEVAAVTGYSAGTISKHRHAGLLPWVPGRPIKHRVGDVLIYRRMILNGVKNQLHRSLHIPQEDRRLYSPLHTVASLTDENYKTTIANLISETDAMWKKFVMARDAAKAETKRKRAA